MKASIFSDLVRRRLAASHLSIILTAFVGHLQSLGYASWTIRDYAGAVEHFGGWLKSRRLNPSPISPELIRSFLRKPLGRCHCPRQAPRDPATCGSALHAPLEWLQIKGIIGQKAGKAASRAKQLIEEFDRYLVEVCGMAQTTRESGPSNPPRQSALAGPLQPPLHRAQSHPKTPRHRAL